jgi:molybdopterin converting factor small subunit
MKVDLKCFAKLVNPDTCNFKESTSYELDNGQTVEHLLEQAQIKRADVKIAFVNSRIADFETVLSEGDRVGLAPAVGGM